MTDYLKKKSPFVWTNEAERELLHSSRRSSLTPRLSFFIFEKVLKVECDSCKVCIGVVLSGKKRPIVFLSEKLNDARKSGLHMNMSYM